MEVWETMVLEAEDLEMGMGGERDAGLEEAVVSLGIINPRRRAALELLHSVRINQIGQIGAGMHVFLDFASCFSFSRAFMA